MKKSKLLIILLSSAFAARIIFALMFVDLESENYWEFGELAKNVIDGKGYSLFYPTEEGVGFKSAGTDSPRPSAYMPPGYPGVLTPFMIIDNIILRNMLIMIFQALLSVLAMYLLYRFTLMRFNEKTALTAAAIYAFLPEFIYASTSYGSVIIYHIAVSAMIMLMIRLENSDKTRDFIYAGLLLGGTMYFRPEFVLFFAMFSIMLLRSGKMKKLFLSFVIAFLCVLPWQIRNYTVFEEFVPMTTSGGQNFYRGHNPYRPGVWCDDEIVESIKKLQADNKYELNLSRMYYGYAFRTIKDAPADEISRSAEKLLHLFLVNPYDNRTENLAYLLPWGLLLVFSILGIYKSRNIAGNRYLYIFLAYHAILAIIFFAIPRYQTMMKIILIPYAAYGVMMMIEYYKARKNTIE
ncbi:MAG: glycosyltransferase family 39 protein [Chlorobi bacterium]|nr:glycosyltransferase family 39 protein [Chlorobiota bacterium]